MTQPDPTESDPLMDPTHAQLYKNTKTRKIVAIWHDRVEKS